MLHIFAIFCKHIEIYFERNFFETYFIFLHTACIFDFTYSKYAYTRLRLLRCTSYNTQIQFMFTIIQHNYHGQYILQMKADFDDIIIKI